MKTRGTASPTYFTARWDEARLRGLPFRGVLLVVDVRGQRLHVVKRGRVGAVYPVSTASRGIGSAADSGRTPPGWHVVASRIGKGLRRGSVLVSRRFTGEVLPRTQWSSVDGPDRILTRILWLRGLEPGRNRGPGVDSYRRFIYLHGTNQEQLLGRPVSHGCIRVGNDDLLALFNRVRGRITWCWIG